MIVVSKVLGESFDFVSGREMGKSLVLTDGQREIVVQVSDEDVRRVLELGLQTGRQVAPAPSLVDQDPGELQGDYRDAETGTESI